MRIIELEQKSGLDRATIRFYEKEGMIHPTRTDNGYRDYSQEDLTHLQRIKLLRQLGMPLNKIKQLQQGSGDIQTILEDQIQILNQKRNQSQRSAQVCKLMQEDGVTYATLNANHYLQKLTTMPLQYPQHQMPAATISYHFSESFQRPYHPIRHFLARSVDMFIFALLVVFFQAIVLGFGFGTKILSADNILLMLFYIPLEALFCMLFAATPGKILFGIRVNHINGCKLSYSSALVRAFRVFRYGLGYGIPIWNLYRLYKSYKAYPEDENCWNEETEITYLDFEKKQIVAWILLAVYVVGGAAASLHMIDLPQNSGDHVTVRQFAENYNNYKKLLYPDAGITMQPDGKFKETEDTGYTGIITGVSEKMSDDNFQFMINNDSIMGFQAVYEVKGASFIEFFSSRLHLGAVALYTSVPGKGIREVSAFEKELSNRISEFKLSLGILRYETEDFKITYEITFKNCEPVRVGEMMLMLESENTQSNYAKLVFTMERK